MSAPTRLYIDTWRKALVAGPNFTNTLTLGDIVYGDVIDFHLYFLELNPLTGGRPNVQAGGPYSIVSVADLDARFLVGDRVKGSASPIVEQSSWTKSADNKYLFSTVSYATAAALSAFVGESPYRKWLEIKWNKGGNFNTVYQQEVTIHPRAGSPTTTVPSSPLTPISKEEVHSGFVKIEQAAGEYRILTSPSGLRFREYIDDLGAVHYDQETTP